ncbi:MAG: acetyl esterase [Polyangiales bacterium]|jgi:acetyl esterase
MTASRILKARRRAGGALAHGFFSGAARLGQLHPLAKPERHGIVVERDVPYIAGSERPEHRLDIYRPSDTQELLPTVLYIHGGGFRILSKETHWIMGLSFAQRGYLVFNVGYRLAPDDPFPAAAQDVAAAFEWLAEHGPAHGADLSRLVIAGESAGANLAAGLALSTTMRRSEPFAQRVFDSGVVPRAVLPACGIFQVSDVNRFARRKAGFPQFLADRLQEIERGYLPEPVDAYGSTIDLADPLNWLERGETPDRDIPPFFLPVGTKDPLLDDTRRFAAAIRALGATAEDQYYPGQVHAFHAFAFLAEAKRCWRDTFEFLDRHV